MSRDPILIDLPEVLLSERIVIRPWRAGDGASLFATVDECRSYLMKYLPWTDQHKTAEDSEGFCRRAASRVLLREDLPMGIWSADTGELLGGVGLHRINWNVPSFEVGYWLAEKHQGHGYVTEAVWMICRLAFETLNGIRVCLICDTTNTASERVAQRVGFRHEGTQINWGRKEERGVFDIQQYALSSAEWLALVASRGK